MKTVFLSSVMLFALSGVQASENTVDVNCTYEIDGNDANRRFGAFSELKESTVYNQFQLYPLQGNRSYLNFDRIVPHADNACLYRNYQIVMLRNDVASVSEFEQREIPYARVPLTNNAAIRISYGGPNETGGDQLTLSVRAPRQGQYLTVEGQRRRQMQARYEFDRSGKAEFDVEFKVQFQYADLGGDGLASFFTGEDCDLTSEDIVSAERDTFTADVKVSCVGFLNEVSDDSSRDAEVSDVVVVEPRDPAPVQPASGTATGFSEGQIIRPGSSASQL